MVIFVFHCCRRCSSITGQNDKKRWLRSLTAMLKPHELNLQTNLTKCTLFISI